MPRDEAGELLTTLLENAPGDVYVYFKDRERRFVRASRSFEALLGRPLREILGRRDEDLFPPEIAKETVADDESVISGRVPFLHRIEGGQLADGVERWVSTSKVPWRDAEGMIRGLFGVSKDISDIKHAEKRRSESEERLRLVLEASGQGTWELDLKRMVATYDARHARMLGYEPEELRSQTEAEFLENLHPEDREATYEAFGAHLAGTSPRYEAAFRLRTKSGGWKWILANAKVVEWDADGAPSRMLGTHMDITGRKRREDEGREQARLKEMLVQEINHRVRNNLSAILGMVGVERSRASLGRRDATAILQDLEQRIRGVAVAHDVLTENQWKAAPMAALCERVVGATVQSRPADRGRVNVNVQASTHRIRSQDAHHLALVLAELTTNALKHGRGSDGTLDLDVRVKAAGGRVSLTFHDNGAGFPEAVVGGLREPHQLGLELVEGIVRHSLRGEVELKNKGGATVVIRFGEELGGTEEGPPS